MVRAEAVAAGLTVDQARDVVLAVHELAANAVRHGGGTGRLRMLVSAGRLRCQVSDDGPADDGQPGSLTSGRDQDRR
jgi:anti-sigma regulatory factor (Ser/Thr protein kinase)